MAAREKEALIENAIRESNTISEECKQELLKYYQKKKIKFFIIIIKQH